MSTHVHHLINDIYDSRYERLFPVFNRTIVPSPDPQAPYTDPRSDNFDEDHMINDQGSVTIIRHQHEYNNQQGSSAHNNWVSWVQGET